MNHYNPRDRHLAFLVVDKAGDKDQQEEKLEERENAHPEDQQRNQ